MADTGKPPAPPKGGSERLTKIELTWLLTQEARSAAQKLRTGVGFGPGTLGLPEATPPPPIIDEGTGGVESTLNRLDEAVTMLATIHGHPTPRGRRGRIDLAALLWEVAPEARVQIEMGEGTTVFGDESELRRMLHVLVGQAGDPASARGSTPEISIRREGDEVRVGVALGPDQSATFETERAWLSRMAVRYGGRIVLDGGMQMLALPADVDTRKREVEDLKKELAAAQAQGEAYARELASVLRTDTLPAGPPRGSNPPPTGGGSQQLPSGNALAVLTAAMRGAGAELRGILSAIQRDLAPLRDREGDTGEIAASVTRHVTAGSEIISDLGRLGACPVDELPRHGDVADLIRDVVRDDVVRAARHDVRVIADAPSTSYEVVQVGALTVLLHALLDHAISASPPGSEVRVTMGERAESLVFHFDDAGPPLSGPARSGILSREFESLAQGRPAGISLVAAHAIAHHLRADLVIQDGPHGGARVSLVLPRGS
jgi:signal transduction histidine kinase